MTMKFEGDSGRAALDDAFAAVAVEVVELAAMVPTPAAVAHAARAQEQLRKLRIAAGLSAWNGRAAKAREEAQRQVGEQLACDLETLALRFATLVLGVVLAEIVTFDVTRGAHGTCLVRVLTRDDVTHGIQFDRTWSHTFVDRVTCIICEGAQTDECPACLGTGGEDLERCVPCRGRGLVACACTRTKAVVR